MRLGEKLETTNPAVLLQNEDGLYRVHGPGGQVERYTCQAGKSIASIEYLETLLPRSNYLIEKIGNVSEAAPSARAHSAGD